MKWRTSFVVMAIAGLASGGLFSQEQKSPKYGWEKEAVGAVNLTQVNFDNWTQGGENTFAWQIILNNKFVNDQEKFNWANTSKFSFGKARLGNSNFRKSVDEIKLESVLTYKLGTSMNPYVAATALTQFASGFQYGDNHRKKISDFLDPGYFTQSIGIGYKPTKALKMRSGFAVKETVTRNFPKPYADDPATPKIEKSRVEIGVDLVTDFSRKLSENILLTSKLEMFSNLKAFDEIDVNWDNLFSTKVSKLINVNFNLKMLYDKNVSLKRQIKQSLAIGFTYTFL